MPPWSPQSESEGNPGRESGEKRISESDSFYLAPKSPCQTQIADGSDHCYNVTSPSLFSNARDFIMNNPQFFTIFGDSNRFMSTNPTSRGQQPCYEDLELEEDIYKGKEYRFYRARVGSRAVVAKVFQGPRANELCIKTADFNRGIMHPNVLQMFGDPWIDSGDSTSSLLFRGDYQGAVEPQLAMALKKGIKEGWIVGANTIIACSYVNNLLGSMPKDSKETWTQLGLDYLQGSRLPFSTMGPEHFVLMFSKQGRIVLGFDVEPTWATVSINNEDQFGIDHSIRAKAICNELIQKTFYASCKTFYEDQRSYEDLDDDDFHETDEASFVTDNGTEEPEDATERQSLPEFNPDTMGHRSTTWKSRQKPKANGHRRELVWNSRRAALSSLEEIGRRYQDALTQSQSDVLLGQYRGRSVTRIAHSCPGYKRTEIILSPELEHSGIVSHISPVPNEICSICGEKVGKQSVFACLCGVPEYIKENHGPKPPCNVSNGCPALRAKRTCTKCAKPVYSPRAQPPFSSAAFGSSFSNLLHVECSSCKTNYCRGCFTIHRCPSDCTGGTTCTVRNCCSAVRAIAIFEALSNFDHIYATEAGFAGQSKNQNQLRQTYVNGQIAKADMSTRTFHSASNLVFTLRVVCSWLQPESGFEEKFAPENLHPSVPKLFASSYLPGIMHAFLSNTNVGDWIQHIYTYGAILDALRCMFDCGLKESMMLPLVYIERSPGLHSLVWDQQSIVWEMNAANRPVERHSLWDMVKQLKKCREVLMAIDTEVQYAPTVEVNKLLDGISYLLLQQVAGGL